MISALLPLLLAAPAVLGHGQVHNFLTADGTVWPAADAYAAANLTSPFRHVNTYGPVPDFTTSDITCGPGGNVPTTVHAPVKAGSTVIFDWGSWSSVHPGPMMTYLASCGASGCSNFKGDSGNIWVKIDQDSYFPDRTTPGPWGENIIHNTPAYYKVTIPTGLAAGYYVIRHEILGLHVAGTYMGAQFYPNCVQIQVTNGGSVELPTGIPLPGSYNPNDTSGILLQLWQIQANPSQLFYIPPGGPVLLPGGTGDWGRATYGGDPQPPLSGSSSASKPTSTATSTVITTAKSTTTVSSVTTTKSSSSSSAPAPTGSGVAQYGQCGGTNYQGSTTCASPFKCVGVSAPYYYQCQ